MVIVKITTERLLALVMEVAGAGAQAAPPALQQSLATAAGIVRGGGTVPAAELVEIAACEALGLDVVAVIGAGDPIRALAERLIREARLAGRDDITNDGKAERGALDDLLAAIAAERALAAEASGTLALFDPEPTEAEVDAAMGEVLEDHRRALAIHTAGDPKAALRAARAETPPSERWKLPYAGGISAVEETWNAARKADANGEGVRAAEGWVVSMDRDLRFAIRAMAGGSLPDDPAAIALVRRRAAEGSELHQAAIAFHDEQVREPG